MRRVLIIGPGGAGKTTLSLALAQRTGLPLVHLDRLYWGPDWTALDSEAWRDTVRQAMAQPAWILDGNYGSTLHERIQCADTVVFLDLPPWLCAVRVVRRWWTYRSRPRPSRPDGCQERITPAFLWWILTYRRRRRPQIIKWLAETSPGTQAIVLRSQSQVDTWLASLNAARPPRAPGTRTHRPP